MTRSCRCTIGVYRDHLVKEDGEWKIDEVEQEESASEETDTSGETTESPDSEEVAAQGAVDAFLEAVRKEDEAVLCGLLTERYAQQILRERSDFAIAECVEAFGRFDWSELQQEARGVTVEDVSVSGDRAIAELSNGEKVTLVKQGGRFVIDGIGR